MKVLRVLWELRPSGVEVSLRVTSDLWADRGVDIDILSAGPTPGPYASALSAAGYRLHHIPLEPMSGFARAYIRLLRRRNYDVVHVHPERGNLYTAGMARLAGVPRVVRSIHNVFPFRGVLGAQRRLQRALLRAMGVDHISVSSSVQATERRYFGNPTQLIYNWFDDRRFRPPSQEEREKARARLGVDGDAFVVVSIGNCSRVKNHAALLSALGRVRAELPVRYVHVGLEEAGHPERALAHATGLDGRADFLGYVDDIAPVLRAADCYVMPSLYEGLGNAALEALGCGVPSILADVEGLRDLKPFIPSVRWVPPTSDAIAGALRATAALQGSRRDELRRTLTAAAHEHFGAARGVDDYVHVYAGRTAIGPDPVPVSTPAALHTRTGRR